MCMRRSIPVSLAGFWGLALLLSSCDALESMTDAAAPRIEASASIDTVWAQSVLPVRGRAADHVGVERVTFRVNDGSETDIAIDPGRYVEFSAKVPIPDEGLNQIVLTAYDARRNHGSDTVNVREDLSGPLVEFQMPDSILAFDTARVRAVVRDPSRVARVTLVYGPGTRDVDLPFDTAVSVNTQLMLVAGRHSLRIEAEDALGNTSGSGSVVLVSDQTGPLITLHAPMLTVADSARVLVTGLDYLDPYDRNVQGRIDRIVAVNADGDETSLWNGAAANVDLSALLPIPAGNADWTIAAYDQVGNRGVQSAATWPMTARNVVVGGAGGCILDPTAQALCWGSNTFGQLGTSGDYSPMPVAVTGGHVFHQVVAGELHECGLDTAGLAWCWGQNFWGQLGNDSASVSQATPIEVAGGHTFTALAAGTRNTCGLDDSGFACCWGPNEVGELGTGDTTPSREPVCNPDRSYRGIAVGNLGVCALGLDGNVYCWGSYPGSSSPNLTPVQVMSGGQATNVWIGSSQACAVDATHALWCWGEDIATGAAASQPAPVTEFGPVTQMLLWPGYACALGTDHVVRCRGSDAPAPTAVLQGMEFERIAGGYRICGIATTGSLYCWDRGT